MSYSRLNLSTKCKVNFGEPYYAEGEFRYVAKGVYTDGNGPRNGQPCVVKWFKSGAVYEDHFFQNDIKAVHKAQQIIDRFNAQNIIGNSIVLNYPEVWEVTTGARARQKIMVEPFIPNYQKFNSNTGHVLGHTPWHQVMQALSHFSYHTTSGQMVLCDLQGGLPKGKGVPAILTDPVILSRTIAFGVTDLGADGISTFFHRHQCNQYCQSHWQKPRVVQSHYHSYAGTTMELGYEKHMAFIPDTVYEESDEYEASEYY